MIDRPALTDLAQSYLELRAGDLSVGGHPVEALVERFGTPCYLFAAAVLRQRYQAVVDSLGVDVLFSLKANPSLAVAGVFHQAGAGAEVASAGEILIAQRAGYAAGQIQFAGPGKSRADLRLAVESELGCIHVESAAEYETLSELARDTGKRPRLGIRVNPVAATAAARIRMAGGGQKFGVDDAMVDDLVQRILADDLVTLHGLHCYAGTQCFDAEAWLAGCEWLLALARRIEAKHALRLPAIALGGGFGVPCFDGDPEFDLQLAGRGLCRLLAESPRAQVCVELGRYLTAPAGVYVTRVRYLKRSGGRRFAVLDGGLHHHGAAAGVGAIIRRPFPIVRVHQPLAPAAAEPITLAGPLCTPQDEFAAALTMPDLAVGDLVAVLCSGAYGLSFSQSAFNGHPAPAEVLVDGATASLVRAAGRPQDALRGQFLPGEG